MSKPLTIERRRKIAAKELVWGPGEDHTGSPGNLALLKTYGYGFNWYEAHMSTKKVERRIQRIPEAVMSGLKALGATLTPSVIDSTTIVWAVGFVSQDNDAVVVLEIAKAHKQRPIAKVFTFFDGKDDASIEIDDYAFSCRDDLLNALTHLTSIALYDDEGSGYEPLDEVDGVSALMSVHIGWE